MRKLIIMCLLVVLIASGCVAQTASKTIEDTPKPTIKPTSEPTTELTANPEADTTVEPTQSLEEQFTYISEIPLEQTFDTVFISQWNLPTNTDPFVVNGQLYTEGLGMYIDPELIMKEQASITAVLNLEKKYDRMTFDLGCEQSMDYDIAKKYGEYEIIIIADGKIAWESGWRDYSYFGDNIEVRIGGECERLELKLKQRKGSKGTLKVVLGNMKLYKN